ncbi:MAG: cell division protein FtsQ/DivIB [Candidatus Margulisbacteria bacterium]|jgi:cell division septal protein FtsQ|nr:cell division protein FtsQ/DivIB [Candidatus Margulisiibacteriota bacterium]
MLRKIFILLLLTLTAAGLWWLAALPVWQIRTVTVTGNGYIPAELIQKRVARWQGRSIFLSTRQNIALDLLWIEDYRIKRGFFPPALTLEIVPREPLFAVTVNGRECIVDAQGVVLNQAGLKIPAAGLLRVAPLDDPADLEYLSKNLLPLYEGLGGIYRYADLQLNIRNRQNIQVLVQDRLTIKFGQAVDLGRKCQALAGILADLKQDLPGIQYIDLSSYKTPAVK